MLFSPSITSLASFSPSSINFWPWFTASSFPSLNFFSSSVLPLLIWVAVQLNGLKPPPIIKYLSNFILFSFFSFENFKSLIIGYSFSKIILLFSFKFSISFKIFLFLFFLYILCYFTIFNILSLNL